MRINIESAQHVLEEIKQLRKEAQRKAERHRQQAEIEDARAGSLTEAIDVIEKLVKFQEKEQTKTQQKDTFENKKDDPKLVFHYNKKQFKEFRPHEAFNYDMLYIYLTNNKTSNVQYWSDNLADTLRWLLDNDYLLMKASGQYQKQINATDRQIMESFMHWNNNASIA